MTIVRPCIVFGPSVDNYLVRLWTKQPFVAHFGMPDPGIQFVHEDDVVDAVVELLEGRHAGAFNVAGDGVMSVEECAALIGLPRRRLPLSAYRRFASLMWRLRASEAPPGSLDFAVYPWIVSNAKLKEVAGWTPRYSSRETFEITMRTHGKLPEGGPSPAVPTPAAAA
jgi:UDP-glucose 4-epimerase